MERGRLDEARNAFENVLKRDPQNTDALICLGECKRRLGNLSEAEEHLRSVLSKNPKASTAYAVLYAIQMDSGLLPQALETIEQALSLQPEDLGFLFSRALTLESLGELSKALNGVNHCLRIHPEWPEALGLKASVLRQMGYADQAIQNLRAALASEPDSSVLHGKLILALQGEMQTTLENLLTETQEVWRHMPVDAPRKIATRVKKDKRLKIAYVSGDFREHPVAYFLEGVIAAHDRTSFEVHLVTTMAGSDKRTEKLRMQADGWHQITGLSDENAAAYLRDLEIDIAIDLSGWTRGYRLGVFRCRAAPLQMTWIGYSGTTGLEEMDYIICDETIVPIADEPFYSEKPLRLPGCYLSMTPPNTLLPDLGPRPLPKERRVLFGSFNTLAKLNNETIDTWAEILSEVEGSILILRARQFNDDGVKVDTAKRFAQRGINTKRLLIEGNKTRKGMLAGYRKVDIALDTFPYGGTTTTFEALCMGVPVITLHGDRWVGLVGASILQSVGREELIAQDRDDYVQKAVGLAKDIDRLVALRTGLSEEVLASPLCDTVAFTHALEDVLRGAWNEWCDRQSPGGD